MKEVGGTMLFFGIGSIVLGFAGYEFILMSWIDTWGTTVGWTIKSVLIVVGGILFIISMRSGEEESG